MCGRVVCAGGGGVYRAAAKEDRETERRIEMHTPHEDSRNQKIYRVNKMKVKRKKRNINDIQW